MIFFTISSSIIPSLLSCFEAVCESAQWITEDFGLKKDRQNERESASKGEGGG